MKKRKLALICAIGLASCGALWAARAKGTALSLQVQSPARKAAKNDRIPDHIYYGQVFSLLARLGNKEDYKQQAGLSEEQANSLQQIAEETEKETAALDEKAQTLIKAYRNQLGDTPLGKQPQAVPAELTDLQQQRDGLILRQRDDLRKMLGDEAFARVETASRRIVHITLTPVQ